jgi:hypothetical protein
MEAPAAWQSAPSPPIGSLGKELAKAQERPTEIALVLAFVIGLAGPWLMLQTIQQVADLNPEVAVAVMWGAAAVCIASLTAGTAVAAFLPSFLLGKRDRQAAAAHAWIGAREVRRYLGSAAQAIKIPTTPEDADVWLVRTADTPQLRPLRFEVALMARRFDEARMIAAAYPRDTPLNEYRSAEARAMVDELQLGHADLSEAREALARIPRGVDRTEAIASMAVLEARKLVGRGDWRAPLVAARFQRSLCQSPSSSSRWPRS